MATGVEGMAQGCGELAREEGMWGARGGWQENVIKSREMLGDKGYQFEYFGIVGLCGVFCKMRNV